MNKARRKRVAKVDKITDEILEIFDSVKNASLSTGYNKNTIRDSCAGIRKSNRTDYNWKYI